MRRTLTILLVSLLHAGCSTCSVWDECEPGEVRSCDYDGCGDCLVSQETCRDNHEWGPCECIEWEEDDDFSCGWHPTRGDSDDPWLDESMDWTEADISFDLPLDEELDPATDEMDGDADLLDVDEEDAELLDVETPELPDDAEEDGTDAPEDAGES